MPRRSKMSKPRKYTKRNYRKKRSSGNTTRQIAFPTNKIVKMRYCETVNIDLTLGTAQYIFSANNLHDPNHTGTGHQPLGYDQWPTWYNHYVVLGSKIKYFITPVDNVSAARAISIGCYVADDATSTTDVQTLIEQGRGSYALKGALSDKPAVISTKYSAKKFFTVKDVKDNFDRLGASFGTAPTEAAFFILNIETQASTSDTFTVLAVIDYIVCLSEPKELPGS